MNDFYSNRESSRWLKLMADLAREESSPPGDVNAPLTGTVRGAARSPSTALPDAPRQEAA